MVKETNIIQNCSTSTYAPKDLEYLEKISEGISLNNIEIKKSNIKGAGLGIFAKKDFEPFDVIEYCHIIIFDWRQKYLKDISIVKYAYTYHCLCDECEKHGKVLVLPLGFGAVYNSSVEKSDANCEFYINIHTPVQIFYAIKKIKAGDEILTYYGDNYINAFLKNK